jgi:hypothetical protein
MLTVFAIEKAWHQAKSYKLSDGNGLHLLVEPNGSKLWRFRYHFDRNEKMLFLGRYPDVSLAAARAKRDDARKLISAATPSRSQESCYPAELLLWKLQICQSQYAALPLHSGYPCIRVVPTASDMGRPASISRKRNWPDGFVSMK